jgi:hypothetical protein
MPGAALRKRRRLLNSVISRNRIRMYQSVHPDFFAPRDCAKQTKMEDDIVRLPVKNRCLFKECLWFFDWDSFIIIALQKEEERKEFL